MSNTSEPNPDNPQQSKNGPQRSLFVPVGLGLGAVMLVSGLLIHLSSSRDLARLGSPGTQQWTQQQPEPDFKLHYP